MNMTSYARNDKGAINRNWKKGQIWRQYGERNEGEDRILDDFKVTILNESENGKALSKGTNSNWREGHIDGEILEKYLHLKDK